MYRCFWCDVVKLCLDCSCSNGPCNFASDSIAFNCENKSQITDVDERGGGGRGGECDAPVDL